MMQKKMRMKAAAAVITALLTAAMAVTVFARTTTEKPTLISFASMAVSIEKDYGTILEMDITLRNNVPVYKADIITEGKGMTVYFDAATGAEQERKQAIALDEEEAKIYSGYHTQSAAVKAVTQVQDAKKAADKTQPIASADAAITYEKAKEIALAKVGGGTVTEIELDYEKGQFVYEIEVKHNRVEHELVIDAETGEIVKYKTDR